MWEHIDTSSDILKIIFITLAYCKCYKVRYLLLARIEDALFLTIASFHAVLICWFVSCIRGRLQCCLQ